MARRIAHRDRHFAAAQQPLLEPERHAVLGAREIPDDEPHDVVPAVEELLGHAIAQRHLDAGHVYNVRGPLPKAITRRRDRAGEGGCAYVIGESDLRGHQPLP